MHWPNRAGSNVETPEQRYKQAHHLEDTGQLDEALALFTEMALAGEYLSHTLYDVQRLQKLAYFKLLRDVEAKHPDSRSVALARIRFWGRHGDYRRVISLSTELLDAGIQPEGTRCILHGLRLNAAIRDGEPLHVVEDFTIMWRNLASERGRSRLLRDVLAAAEPRLADAFRELAASGEFSEEMAGLFRQKADELDTLGAVMATELGD